MRKRYKILEDFPQTSEKPLVLGKTSLINAFIVSIIFLLNFSLANGKKLIR